MSPNFDPNDGIGIVTSGFDSARGADPKFTSIPVAPVGVSQTGVPVRADDSTPLSQSVVGTETVTTREVIDIGPVIKPGPSQP
jgi:hypothetical protein